MKERTPLPDKYTNFSRWYDEVSERAELADSRYGVKGFVVYRPSLMFIVREIYESLERHLIASGHRPILFPLLIPYRNLQVEKEHVRGFENQVFIVEKAGGKKIEERLFIRPTSETAVYPVYRLWIRSYRDLPFKAFQSCAVYRHETRATRPLFRGREFLWIESHDVFHDGESAMKQTREDLEIMKKTCKEFALPFLPIEREKFDRFPGAERSFAYDSILPDRQALQLGTTHLLGSRFTKPFGVRFLSKSGEKKIPHSTCFGPGVSRIAGLIVSVHGDEYGLVLPFKAAQVQVVIVPVRTNGEVTKFAKKIKGMLQKAGIRVEIDNGSETVGEKFYRWEMQGVPVRVEVGPMEVSSKKVTLVRRDQRKKKLVGEKRLLVEIRRLEKEILAELERRAWKWLNSNIHEASSREEIVRNRRTGGFIRISFCGRKVCADEIKEETEGYEVRGRRIDVLESPKNRCTWCGERAVKVAYLAKAY